MKSVFELIEEHGLTLHGDIEHFAELVRADEREACAKVCDEQVERSKAALEKAKRTTDHAVYRAGAQTAAWNAAAIRARSKT